MSQLQELATRRQALQLQAQDQRRGLRRHAAAIDDRLHPLRRALPWARTAALALKLRFQPTKKGPAMTTTTETTPPAAPDAKDRVAASLRKMVDEADRLLKGAADAGDEKFDEARIRLEHQLRSLRLQLDELEDKAVHRARQAARRADETVHSHPYGAMGVAAAAGLLIGVLLGRR